MALVEKATVQIVAQGTFSDPSGQAVTQAGAGSGFIISEDGLVVTNNHVVTGAATLNVFVPDRRGPVNARVIGASECADLAVIQLPPGTYPFLGFHEGPLAIGTSIFAAGYPLGEPQYALVAGIISKLDADGESSWASVDQVLQHDAAVSPGNSGGPLVTEAGDVVGIVYASLLEFNQFFAVGLEQALPVLEQLIAGSNVDWIGINGEAYIGQASSGLWVASVESGSPADEAGILPGDFIIEMERLPLGDDGTMRDYCDVLQTRGSDRVMQVKLIRQDTGETLEGQINGRPLVSTDTEYVSVVDDSGRISVTVPASWELNTAPEMEDPNIDTAPDLAAFYSNFSSDPLTASAPGIAIGIMDSEDGSEVTEEELLLHMEFNPGYQNCFFDHQEPYSDPLYTGYIAVFACSDGGVMEILGATEDGNPVYIASIISLAYTPADTEAVQGVYASFVMYTQDEHDGDVHVHDPPPDEPEIEYLLATDDTGLIVANVRRDWGVDGTRLEAAPMLNASPDIEAWMDDIDAWADLPSGPGTAPDTTGIMLLALFGEPGDSVGDADLEAILDATVLPPGCTPGERFHYADPLYGGRVLESNCGGETKYTFLAVYEMESPTYIVVILSVTQSDAERQDVQEFYDTFIVYPDPGVGGDPDAPPGEGEGSNVPGGVVEIWDDTLTIYSEVPQPWESATDPVESVPIINVAPNLDDWFGSAAGDRDRHSPPYPNAGPGEFNTNVAGIFITLLSSGGADVDADYLSAFLDIEPYPTECSYEGRKFFEGDGLSGQFDESVCSPSGTHRVYALLHLDYPGLIIWIEAVTVSADDELALIHFLSRLTILIPVE
ncbi:MAG: S1C family serine protease [Chloroflexota bacterium]|nr:S1C family serine protease [Chloroflexota bacterium]MDP6758523.1 S1C family serine protease [Chloroflexota bacterium]